MLLWIGFAVLTAGVVAILLRPLLAAPPAPESESDQAPSTAVYRDQFAEIEAERARGLIGDAEAQAARIEIARRLLATADPDDRTAGATAEAGTLRTVALLVAGALPVLAMVVYLSIGAPGQQGQPHASRGLAPAGAGGVEQLVAKVEERLRAYPEDGRGWDVIGPVYLRMGRYREAADAFQNAIRLVGESPERLAGLAEAHVLANDGIVTEVARTAYVRLRTLAPDRMEPRYWLAVADEQDGRLEEAVQVYASLLSENSATAPWRPAVAERWRAVRRKLGQPTEPVPAGKVDVPAPEGDGAVPQGQAPTLSREDVRAVQALPEAERRKVIEGMVAGLDKRLREDGADLEGWQRLIRAYVALGRRDEAMDALARARTGLAGEAKALEALGAFARTLGLAS